MKKKYSIVSLLMGLLICSLLQIGCAQKESDDEGSDGQDGNTNQETAFSISQTTNESGQASTSFVVAAGTTKFSVTASADSSDYIAIASLESTNGKDYLTPNSTEVTLANMYFRYVNFATIPSRIKDGVLTDGTRYTVTAQVVSSQDMSPVADARVTFFVNSKDDTNLDGGSMRVNVFFVGDIGQDTTSKSVMDQAIDEFIQIYSSAANIAVNIFRYDISGPSVLPLPVSGSSFYKTNSSTVPSPSVNLFVSGDISGLDSSDETLGISGGIPGPAISSERSAVAISIFGSAGADGNFDSEDIRLLGETIAHETGHYLGLFHPVDLDGNSVSVVDPLDDTPECTYITNCLQDEELITNLMFLSPVPNNSGNYTPQTNLTQEQRGVLNRYIAVN